MREIPGVRCDGIKIFPAKSLCFVGVVSVIMRVKKILIVLTACLFLLTGCVSDETGEMIAMSFRSFLNSLPLGDVKSPSEIANWQIEQILQGVVTHDADMLKNILISPMQNSDEIDRQVSDFLDFVDGNVISHSDPRGSISSESMRDGEITSMGLSGHVSEILTDTGRKYLIRDDAVEISSILPDEFGVYYIFMRDITDGLGEFITIGDELFTGLSLEDVLNMSLVRELYMYDESGNLMSDDFLQAWRWAMYYPWPEYMGFDFGSNNSCWYFIGYDGSELFALTMFNNTDIVLIESDNMSMTYRVVFTPGCELP